MKELLPIGSVVLLKNTGKKIMIIGFCQKKIEEKELDKIWDYAGCLYPEGYMSPDTMYLFDHEEIDKIYSLGYRDDEQFAFQEKLQKAIEDYKNKTEEGK